jgi:hypothetical protein
MQMEAGYTLTLSRSNDAFHEYTGHAAGLALVLRY